MKDKKLLGLGFNTELIEKILSKSLTVTALRGTSRAALLGMGFSEEEAKTIAQGVNRSAIPTDTIEQLMLQTGEVCCYCADGNKSRPFQIHHINEYADSRDHSLDNLVLVCPTHHVHIHLSKIAVGEQHAVKRAWSNLWEIALGYVSKGFSFPFGAFEYIDYTIPGSVTDIFSFGPAKPAVCRQLTEGQLLQHAQQLLTDHHSVLITGESGSGKTTLSLAIAASAGEVVVFRYLVGQKDSLGTVNEIVLFLGMATRPLLLIIDDANTKLIPGHIEKILSVAQSSKKIIVVNTKVELSGTENLEQRTAGLVMPITWPLLQKTVKTNMLKHEVEILGYLKSRGLDKYNGDQIGYSITDRRFRHVLDSYASGTQSVWQFIFMLASGETLLNSRLSELFAQDRLDLLVVFLAANQIATVEQGASLAEIQNFFMTHPHFAHQEQPSLQWLESQIDQLVKWRMIKKNRDRFNLAHRMLALNFLRLCYLRDQKNTEQVFDMFFRSKKPVRNLLILWSWIKEGRFQNYTVKWMESLSLEDWNDLAHQAAREGLVWMSIMTEILHPTNKVILSYILKDKAEIFAEIVDKHQQDTLYYFDRLAVVIRYHAPQIWPDLLEKLDKDLLYHKIRNATPWEIDKLSGLFYSIKENPANIPWILELTDRFSNADFNYMASRLEKGDVRTFSELMGFWRGYVSNISVGEFVDFMGFIPRLLKDCKITDVNFAFLHSGYSEIVIFPDLIDNILMALDPKKMAEEYVDLTPDAWGNVLPLSYLAAYGRHSAITSFLAQLDLDKLSRTLELYFRDDLYSFRQLIYQLSYANSRQTEIAELLRPLVVETVSISMSTGGQEHESILEAFAKFDKTWVDDYCIKANISLEKLRKDIRKENERDKEDLFYRLKDLMPEDFAQLLPAYKISLTP